MGRVGLRGAQALAQAAWLAGRIESTRITVCAKHPHIVSPRVGVRVPSVKALSLARQYNAHSPVRRSLSGGVQGH